MWEYNTDYLAHYGIRGQKWGTRRWQNEDGSLTPDGRVHYGYNSKDLPAPSKKAAARIAKSNAKAAARIAKSNEKEEKRQDKINRAQAYTKAWNKANRAEEASEKAWNDVKSQYKSLGKTPIGRLIQVSKAQRGKGSEAANKYLQDWDKAEKLSDKSYEATQDMKKKYANLGKNNVSRLITAMRYS